MSEKKKCFVIMPFGKFGTDIFERNKKIYTQMIKPVVEGCGYESIRADELEHPGNITRDIIELLFEANLVIADLSDRNANVFYELGVRHSLIKFGTIPIIREGEDIPFDIKNYRVLFYSTELDGPEKFRNELSRRIHTIDQILSKKSDNPVHDTLGDSIPQIDVIRHERELMRDQQQEITNLKHQLAHQEDLKQQAVKWPQEKVNFEKQITELQKDLQNLIQENQKLGKTLSQQKALEKESARWIQEKAGYEQKIAELQEKVQKLSQQEAKSRPESPKNKPVPVFKPLFRSKSETLSRDDVKKMLKEKDFFDSDYHKNGHGFENKFEEKNLKGEKVIIDHAAGLMWQQGGSDKYMPFNDTDGYIKKLNADKFAGLDDWRLPTLEEAMSLTEPKKNQAGLYIDDRFDATQRYFWTADQVAGGSLRWVVDFSAGYCFDPSIDYDTNYVRLVRSGLSFTGE